MTPSAMPEKSEERLAALMAAWALVMRVAADERDPYPLLADARRRTPVLREDGPSGSTVLVFRHDDVAEVLRDADVYSSSILSEGLGRSDGARIVVSMDEPEHRRHRALVSTAFRPKALARWEATLLPELAHRLVEGFAADGEAELVARFTIDYPAQVIASILGLPPADFHQFQRWSFAVMEQANDPGTAAKAMVELREYVDAVIAERRSAPEDDLITDLAHAELDGERLTDEDIFTFVRMLLPAGVETTFRSLGNVLFLLLTHPGVAERVRADQGLLPAVVEEMLRYEVPMLITSRVAARDTVLRGVEIPAGASVTTMIGAANRDEERWRDPDRFDPFRQPTPHIAFGHGAHLCLGLHLARAEARVATAILLDQLPNLRLDLDDGDPHIHGQIFRSPTTLPARWG